jgi:hypothetical protein
MIDEIFGIPFDRDDSFDEDNHDSFSWENNTYDEEDDGEGGY